MPNTNKKQELAEQEIKIELRNFKYSNLNHEQPHPEFFGRSKEFNKLLDHLNSTKKSGGSFLVTGYRGAGKTRFVSEVLKKYKYSKKNVIQIKVNLGSDKEVDSKTILSQMVTSFENELEHKITPNFLYKIFNYLKKPLIIAFILLIILIIVNHLSQNFKNTHQPPYSSAVAPEKEKNEISSGNSTNKTSHPPKTDDLPGKDQLNGDSTTASTPQEGILDNVIGFFHQIQIWICDKCKKNEPKPRFLLDPYEMDFLRCLVWLLVILPFLFMFPLCLYWEFLNKFTKPLKSLKKLHSDIYSTTDSSAQFGWRFFGLKKNISSKPLDNNQIESRLKNILKKECKKLEIIFVFDELDKLSGMDSDGKEITSDFIKESKLRKKQIDTILGDLKNLITNSKARYIFIGGRDMYDAYLSERGNSNSLYESLFNDYIYIPSLLTDRHDHDYLLDGMVEAYVVSNLPSCEEEIRECLLERWKDKLCIETKDCISYLRLSDYVDFRKYKAKSEYSKKYNFKDYLQNYDSKSDSKPIDDLLINHIHILKSFIHFLTLHSWGNCKRLFTMFESFVRQEKDRHYLVFSTKDIQRLVLASHLYILFHHNLSRMLMNADDKLLVSSFSVFHYIMKYHGIGFSRGHILRMYETINIHSSPELTRIVDIIIHNVLKNHIRRIRNSFYRYRFSFLHEQEIHFITTINDGESAAFNFSLDAMDAVKQHYRNLIKESQYSKADQNFGIKALASIHVVVGNFHFWEQAYDEANIHYGIALDMLTQSYSPEQDSKDAETSLQQVDVYLKQGTVAERIGSYSAAASIYMSAEKIANECLKNIEILSQDSKWDILRQPKWARHFLNLKQSAVHYKNVDKMIKNDSETESDVFIYRKAVLSFFMENYPAAFAGFCAVVKSLNTQLDSERSSFLKGNAHLKAGFCILLKYSDNLFSRIHEIRSKTSGQQDLANDLDSSTLSEILNILFCSIDQAISATLNEENNTFKTLNELIQGSNFSKNIECAAQDENALLYALTLMNQSASTFKKGQLNVHAATSYLSMIMMWEALLSMIPWHESYGNWEKSLFPPNSYKYSEFHKKIKELKKKIGIRFKGENWVLEAQEEAYICTANNTSGAFDHFIKTTWKSNLGFELEEPLYQKPKSRERALSPDFLKNNLYQHYSVFGQALTASIYWEDFSVQSVCGTPNGKPDDTASLLQNGQFLPFGIRYYSIMLWLKGKAFLQELRESNASCSSDKYIETAFNAIVNLYRSSQYVIKAHGENASAALPPLFMIYYNIWEVLFICVLKNMNENKSRFERAAAKVLDELDKLQKRKNIADVSIKVFDILNIELMALAQLKINERMGDQNSSDRTSILRNKYYLDDDYEDNSFFLDWCYCRFFAPTALVHRLILKHKMNWIRNKTYHPNE